MTTNADNNIDNAIITTTNAENAGDDNYDNDNKCG